MVYAIQVCGQLSSRSIYKEEMNVKRYQKACVYIAEKLDSRVLTCHTSRHV
jgi:integrase